MSTGRGVRNCEISIKFASKTRNVREAKPRQAGRQAGRQGRQAGKAGKQAEGRAMAGSGRILRKEDEGSGGGWSGKGEGDMSIVSGN